MAKTLVNLSGQLHRWLEGEAISVGDIPKMDSPLEYFSSGNLGQNVAFLILHFWFGWTFSSTNQNRKFCNSFSFVFIERFEGPLT
jgi:hypothetical protein